MIVVDRSKTQKQHRCQILFFINYQAFNDTVETIWLGPESRHNTKRPKTCQAPEATHWFDATILVTIP